LTTIDRQNISPSKGGKGKMKCPKCGKEGAYVRIKTKEVVCNKCGYIGKKED